MPNMSDGYRNAIANHGASLITHIGLVDENGTELEGGSPAYIRKAVTWTEAPASGTGVIRPNADITFDIPEDTTVGGWRGYSQEATGGTNYGGKALTQETFASQGEYKLLSASTGILHSSPA